MVGDNCEGEPLRFPQSLVFYVTWLDLLFNVLLLDLDLYLE